MLTVGRLGSFSVGSGGFEVLKCGLRHKFNSLIKTSFLTKNRLIAKKFSCKTKFNLIL
jgi:hypothetical protein